MPENMKYLELLTYCTLPNKISTSVWVMGYYYSKMHYKESTIKETKKIKLSLGK